MIKIYNTLSKKKEDFIPLNPPAVTMYTCGPTVYDYTHIGHLRTYVGCDVLRRTLELDGYQVKQVMNVTDVGHLVSDEDTGEDKMEKGARLSGKSVWEVAKFFEEHFWQSIESLNIERPNIVAKATEHIEEQIKLIHKLEKNGFIYQTEQALYFDISKFPSYAQLSGQNLDDKSVGARSEVVVDPEKKNPHDFAVWFFTVGHFEGHVMKWPSPWGEGFPGWHIECSAMSMEYLGDTLDIHSGGIDHVAVHHTNEIAQSEAATGKPFVRFWVHYNFLQVDGEKMSKSKNNFYRIEEIIEKGFDPLALRYLFLTAHYRDKLNFTWESLAGAQQALEHLREKIRLWEQPKGEVGQFWQAFVEAAKNDLNMPQAVGQLWEMVRMSSPTSSRSRDLLEMDKILGLGLDRYLGKPIEIPEVIQKLVTERESARKADDFARSDQLRKKIQRLGYEVEDTPTGPKIK